jgi:BCCT family betaine/carnitine transporter
VTTGVAFLLICDPIGWASYTLPAVAIAYAVYVEKRRSLRFSSTSQGLLVAGGVKAAQTSNVVVALPLIPILVVLTWSLMRWLRASDPATNVRSSDSSARESA